MTVLDFDTAEAFGFDATGTDGDRRFPYTTADALEVLHRRADALIEAGVLTVHDGDLPYLYEIPATRDARYAAMLELAHPGLAQACDDAHGTFLGLPETLFNTDPATGRPDADLPVGHDHVRLLRLLTALTPMTRPELLAWLRLRCAEHDVPAQLAEHLGRTEDEMDALFQAAHG